MRIHIKEGDINLTSLLEVNEEDYKICNNANLIKSHNDRETTIPLEKSCLFFFIGGAEEHCQKGQRLEVMVLSEKMAPATNYNAGTFFSSSPSPLPCIDANPD
ncbi:early nodulin-like protein 1 [Olea europaea var. sylvestris]|uniref:early nodulin-like protein 1 n=1 Tax=Olea europaea var. sylvestris TaxID=158386 RepID=UPI000C1D69AD|nr:early nodulin-like protein 1 [Olea europaea var. sylvestris]